MNKKEYAAIDIARYISALLVVCIHTYPFIDISETFNIFWLQTICRLAVPFFFVVSGFFFFKKQTEDENENRELLKKYVSRLLKLYIIWTIIYIPYTIWNYSTTGFAWYSIFAYIRDFFMSGSYYHLWFLPALMIGMVLVCKMYEKKGLSFTLKASLALYIIGYFINIYAPIWESLPVVKILYGFFTKTIVTPRNGIFFAPLFLSMGMLLAKTKGVSKKESKIGFIVSFLFLVVEVTIYYKLHLLQYLSSMFITLIPAVYFMVSYLLKVKIPYKEQYKIFRQESVLIYTSHILFVKVLFLFSPKMNLIVYFLTLACSQCFASIVIRNKEKYPILENLM